MKKLLDNEMWVTQTLLNVPSNWIELMSLLDDLIISYNEWQVSNEEFIKLIDTIRQTSLYPYLIQLLRKVNKNKKDFVTIINYLFDIEYKKQIDYKFNNNILSQIVLLPSIDIDCIISNIFYINEPFFSKKAYYFVYFFENLQKVLFSVVNRADFSIFNAKNFIEKIFSYFVMGPQFRDLFNQYKEAIKIIDELLMLLIKKFWKEITILIKEKLWYQRNEIGVVSSSIAGAKYLVWEGFSLTESAIFRYERWEFDIKRNGISDNISKQIERIIYSGE